MRSEERLTVTARRLRGHSNTTGGLTAVFASLYTLHFAPVISLGVTRGTDATQWFVYDSDTDNPGATVCL